MTLNLDELRNCLLDKLLKSFKGSLIYKHYITERDYSSKTY